MNEIAVNGVGVGAALCSMGSFLPQVIKIWRERDASAVSLRMYVVTVTGFSLWTLYGFLLGSWPLIGSNLVSLGLSAAILVLKLKFDGDEKGRGSDAPRPSSEALSP
jgi:MtN3 and saliva related transmembrane protein